ncbi:MAG: tyrosine-type recombinase/integrase, partial [Halobacteriales archaeon]|nr:tyrosine-type recombinase/integrase [Halobacteriales archaeon]
MGVEGRSDGASSVEDPVAYFLQDITYHGKTERTRAAYERVLRRCEQFFRGRGVGFREAGQRDCMAWVHSLRGGHAPSTVATYASYLHRFYAYMTQVGAFDANPMTLVMEEMDESIDTDPARRDIDVSTMRSFVAEIRHPLDRALVVTLLKTGMRVGELCNLDLRDVSLDDERVRDAYGVTPRAHLDGRPDSVFVASDPSRGATYNGEERSASNKRKRDTVIPIDAELKAELTRWLAVRPDTRSPAQPLFLSTRDRWGERVTPKMVRSVVADHAERRG